MITCIYINILAGIVYLICGVILVLLWTVPLVLAAAVYGIYYFCKWIMKHIWR